MRTYPVMLNVLGRTCVVVGAGAVGVRKASALAAAGAKVRLVAPRIDEKSLPPGVDPVRQNYDERLLSGAVLVFACTDDRQLNSRIAADARRAGALVNAVDQPEDCDFYVPAVLAEGDVLVAVGTGGSAPALAAHLKKRLAEHLPARLGEFAAALDEVRRGMRPRLADRRRRARLMEQLADQRGYDEFMTAGVAGLRRLAEQLLKATP